MTPIENYDVVVLGSGEAGKFMSWHMASSGKRTAVIERKYLGGACPNIACLPSKNVVHCAKVASHFQRSEEYGVRKPDWSVSMPAVRAHKQAMIADLHQMHLDNFAKSGAEIIMGAGRFIAEKAIEVSLLDGGVRRLHGDMVFINTGTRARVDPIPGMVAAHPLTHVEALELDTLPQHLLIVGGGYVGLEFAQAMRRFGTRVTIIESHSRLVHREDEDVSAALEELFQDEGIEVVTGVDLLQVEGVSGADVALTVARRGAERVIHGSHLLVATGRVANTEGIGLDLAGVATTEHGYVRVNDKLETTAPGVWALGDCAGSPFFTHISFDDFRVVSANLSGGHRTTAGRQVPSCLFTDPEFACVGLREHEAKEKGIPYRLAKVPMKAVLRSRAISETRGFLKALVSEADDRILGYAGIGVSAGETMAAIQVAMRAGLSYVDMRNMIIAHPTFGEGIVALFSAVPPKQA